MSFLFSILLVQLSYIYLSCIPMLFQTAVVVYAFDALRFQDAVEKSG